MIDRDIRWPGGSRIAVNFVLNLEEGAERSLRHGDDEREPTAEAVYELDVDERDLIQESTFDFGARIGAPRVARLFRDAAVPLTVFASGRAVIAQPETVKTLTEMGCDFVGHGFRWEPHQGMTEEQERASIRRTVRAIEQHHGQRPRGWFTRPLPSLRTRRLLVEEGFEYDSDSLGDELPYRVSVSGGSHLVIPYTLDVNDTRFWRGSMFTGEHWYRYARDAFDYLRWESTDRGAMLSVGLHGRIIGRPARSGALQRFLEYVTGHDDVWLCRREDILDHWVSLEQ